MILRDSIRSYCEMDLDNERLYRDILGCSSLYKYVYAVQEQGQRCIEGKMGSESETGGLGL